MAVSDVKRTSRAVPLWARVLVAAGLAAAGWLLAGLLGGPAASADELPQGGEPDTSEHAQQRGLLGGLLGGTLDTLTNTVEQVTSTLQTTVTAVTQTVGGLTTAVTETTNAVVQPVTETLRAPVTTTPKHQDTENTRETGESAVQTRIEREPEPVRAEAPAPERTVSAPATPAVASAPEEHQVRHREHPVAPAPGPRTEQAPVADHTVHADRDVPAPVPSGPAGQVCGVAPAHDGGSGSKHPLAILGTGVVTPELSPAGIAPRPTSTGGSRDAALPTTSPD